MESEMASTCSSAVSSTSASFSHTNEIVKPWRNRRRTLPELMADRQTFGSRSRANISRRVPNPLLSYRSAWNPSRLQNMTLAVGPGTPASVLMTATASVPHSDSDETSASYASSSSPAAEEEEESDRENEIMEQDDDDDDDEEDEVPTTRRSRWGRRHREEEEKEQNESAGNDEEDDDDDDDDEEEMLDRQRIVENALLEWYGADEDVSQGDNNNMDDDGINNDKVKPVPSMRHGGCINTAAWLDCGWRLSTTGIASHGVATEECPTQVVTSGDDYLVKFWDVSYALGMSSPLPGGYSTICPFSAPTCSGHEETRKRWKSHYAHTTKSSYMAGCVLPLATLRTGHHGNVFHVTPLVGKPGKVATCGADGFLRVSDLETGNASIVVSPEYEDDIDGLLPVGLLHFRPGMCFSHHFLSQNTGLLCSERGLRRFDLRLPPREQPTRSLLGSRFRGCKACAIWSSPQASSALEEGETVYAFAGGPSADVALCDLRMSSDGSSSRIIQQYRPHGLGTADHVSVSGLDLTRDRKELLVSYESDQIYTFPVFPNIKSPAGPSVDEIQELHKANRQSRNKKVLTELAAYGGHLNRFTFLKNAKYAGPRDEYICTGSDSGHAWVYEKSTGSVVSFLNADHSTCNGVIPHPSLPAFITYGIDSTAKLWRATNPVDSNVDDSPLGRRECDRKLSYSMSPTVKKWGEVQQVLKILESEDCMETDIMPDHIPSTKVLMQPDRFGTHFLREDGPPGRRIGNDLHNLPETLKANLYSCLRSLIDASDTPVESDIESLKHRISLIRLRHQADRLGLIWNPSIPWQFELRQHASGDDEKTPNAPDLVPDAPSDWIPYDPEMCKTPWDFNGYFNTKEYGDFYSQHYTELADVGMEVHSQGQVACKEVNGEQDEAVTDAKNDDREEEITKAKDDAEVEEASVPESDMTGNEKKPCARKVVSSSDEEECPDKKFVESVRSNLHDTILLLKNGGNAAMQSGDFDLAARRYDKAIQYGAVATMSFPVFNLDFARGRRARSKDSGGFDLEWRPITRVLIITRLNLALLMLKPHFSQPVQAAEQAKLVLHDLQPFCAKKGKVMKGTKLDCVHRADEPEETFIEAKGLQAKAYFRLGTAQYEIGNYDEAVESFEKSVKSTEQTKRKPDNLVLKRLAEAKRENRRKNNRRRKKFKFAFGVDENHCKEGN